MPMPGTLGRKSPQDAFRHRAAFRGGACFAKKGNPKKATPTIVLILRCSEKSGTKKTRFAQTVFRSDRFFPPLLGANQRGRLEQTRGHLETWATNARTLHADRIAHVVMSPKSRYNKSIDFKSVVYSANQQIMICTIKKLYAQSAYKTR
jgi:hypothetical protein